MAWNNGREGGFRGLPGCGGVIASKGVLVDLCCLGTYLEQDFNDKRNFICCLIRIY